MPPVWKLFIANYLLIIAMKINRNSLPSPRIEMMPLIDVVFLLLVFFIYAMLSMTVHYGQKINLPDSGSVALETEKAVAVTVRGAGQGMEIFVNGERVAINILSEKLAVLRKMAKDSGVQIFADNSLLYQDLFHILDKIKEAGFCKISLQAKMAEITKK